MNREGHPRAELDDALLAAYAATFISRTDIYPLQLKTGAYATIKKPCRHDIVAAHLRGAITIGVYALDKTSQAKWLCLDADNDGHWQQLVGLANTLAAQGITPYLEQSRRGGHLWLFTAPMPGRDIRRFGFQLLREHQITGVELYPKQDRLTSGPGSLVRLPLGIHRMTDRRYHFVTVDGAPRAGSIREQIALLADPQRIPEPFIAEVLARAPEPRHHSPTPAFEQRDASGETLSERIRARISVFDFVSQYVRLDSQGRGLCPFHDDQHESFGVSRDGNYWHCYAGCGGGSVIDFWMKWRERQGVDGTFKAAVKDLARMLLND